MSGEKVHQQSECRGACNSGPVNHLPDSFPVETASECVGDAKADSCNDKSNLDGMGYGLCECVARMHKLKGSDMSFGDWLLLAKDIFSSWQIGLCFGLVAGSILTTYAVADALIALDRVVVCK